METPLITKDYKLTKREKEVLFLLGKGYNNSEISNRLNCTIHTTKAHIGSILYKLEAKSRLAAVIVAIKENLI